ncbi:MAG: HyaD/HybD family hydrogenase maturation endopeptidase [Desulfuromonadaceae bacterium]|nr:HyaD/HybD family hydrogenase maturation endopeptidase [Desulfuromonadaceae bacterium]MDD2850049.1 HyaD/HybD family hydrogenase maturation endopeptidase [Desulfuromonadaceae bacterium]MDD4129453.1 HyaD/HybD family hydrogenase maturation endopeptidase [Desulfuromonadaceae bacterium]
MTVVTPQISVLVLGIGNLVMGDDAVGVLVAQRIQQEYRFAGNVEIMDGGTLGLDLLPKLENITNLIMIDAVETGKKAGTCVRLCGEELPIALQTKVSPHQMGLKDLLAVSELMGHSPKEMVLIGVQPGSIEMEIGLTAEVQAQLSAMISSVLSELAAWGIEAVPV